MDLEVDRNSRFFRRDSPLDDLAEVDDMGHNAWVLVVADPDND